MGLAGFVVEQLTSTPLTQFKVKLNARLKTAWEHYWWPELMRSELRYYRDAYSSATTYAVGAQVYYATTGAYYECILISTANAPSNATYWTQTMDLSAYISLDQTGQTAIGQVRGVYVDDPMSVEDPRRLPYLLGSTGIQVIGDTVPKSVYVWFQLRPNEFLGADYSATAIYASGSTRYYASTTAGYEGDYWVTTATTAAAESPESAAAKWSRLEFPIWLREAVAHGTYTDWLRLDGAADLALAEDGEFEGKLSAEIIKLAGQGQILRSRSA